VVLTGFACVVVGDTVVLDAGRVVVDTVVVVSSVVVVVVVSTGILVKDSGGTIDHPLLSIFHASMKHVPPPFS
jgi:hypothetical protein